VRGQGRQEQFAGLDTREAQNANDSQHVDAVRFLLQHSTAGRET
jgi:hypothetical protein